MISDTRANTKVRTPSTCQTKAPASNYWLPCSIARASRADGDSADGGYVCKRAHQRTRWQGST